MLATLECLDIAASGGRAWWVAPSYKMSEMGWRPLRQIAARIPGAQIRKVDKEIILPGGGMVGVRSADNPDSLRGEGLDYVVMDEAAYIVPEAWSEALRPALSDRLGRALIISTPHGHNWFWDVHVRGASGEPDWASYTYPTSANPFISPAEIEAARRDLTEMIYEQEYLAQFVDSDGAVFRRVREAAINRPVDEPRAGHQYILGVDTATSIDYTVITVIDATDKAQVYMDRFTRIDYPALVDRIVAVCQRYRADAVVVESNAAGQPVVDMCYARGVPVIPFVTSQASKDMIIRDLQSAFERCALTILDDQVLVNELLSYEGRKTASGLMSYSAPPGMHDDCVMSLALAWHAAQSREAILFEA